jgi:hypothetical protein
MVLAIHWIRFLYYVFISQQNAPTRCFLKRSFPFNLVLLSFIDLLSMLRSIMSSCAFVFMSLFTSLCMCGLSIMGIFRYLGKEIPVAEFFLKRKNLWINYRVGCTNFCGQYLRIACNSGTGMLISTLQASFWARIREVYSVML